MSTIVASNLQASGGGGTAARLASINGGPISGARNKVINGDMRIAQRGTSAVTINTADPSSLFGVDRFYGQGETTPGVYTLQQSAVAPAGYTNSLLATVTTADATLASTANYCIGHRIEGFNIADLGFGTASASSITLSFWVRSSITGTFGGSITNLSTATRAYGFTYTISSANTFEYKSITIPGDTTGTWAADNTLGMSVHWSLGANNDRKVTPGSWSAISPAAQVTGAIGETSLISTNGATFYLTGVQLEAGGVATPFERRSYGQELMLCQRYYAKLAYVSGYISIGGLASTAAIRGAMIYLPTPMRATPTWTLPSAGTTGNTIMFLQPSTATPVTLGTHAAEAVSTQAVHIRGDSYTSLGSVGQTSYLTANGTVNFEAAIEL